MQYNTEYEAGQIISQEPKFVDGRKIKQNTDVKVVLSLGTEKTTVPKLAGLTKAEAETAAKDAKVKLEIIEEVSKTVEAGYVIKQETEPDTEINAGDTVKVYLSIGTGIEQVVVSSVLYKDEATARQTLEGLGLVVEIEYGKDELFDWTNEDGQVRFTKVANDTVTYVANTGEIIEAVENVNALNAIEGKEGDLRVVYTDEGAVVYRCSEEKVREVDATENVYKTVNGKVLSTTKTNFVTWYMIPQDLTGVTTDATDNGNVTDEGTIVTIEYVADGKDITQKFSLAVDGVTEDWTKETCVRYNVTIAPHKIIFNPSVDKWNTDLDKDGDDDTDNEENDKDHVDMNN